MAWQGFVYPTSFLVSHQFPGPIVGRVRSSRKEARLEALRLANRFVDAVYRPGHTMQQTTLPRVHQLIPIDSSYGELAQYGVRWQPDPDA